MNKKTLHITNDNRIKSIFRAPRWTWLLFSGAFVLFFCYHLYAYTSEIITPPEYEYQKINIFAGKVDAVGWDNPDAVLDQNKDEGSLYDNFTEINSATIDEVVVEELDESVPSVTDNSGTNPEGDTSSAGLDESVEMSEQPTDSTPAPEAPVEESVEPEPAPETVSDNSTSILNFARGVYRLANAVLTSSSTEGDESGEPEPVPEVVVEEPPAEEVPVTPVIDTAPPLTIDEAVTDIVSNLITEEMLTGTSSSSTSEPYQVTAGCVVDDCTEHYIELSNFNVGTGFEFQEIVNAQLRVSLAAKPNSHNNPQNEVLTMQYYLEDEWNDGGAIIFDEEISNGGNGGYFLLALPIFDDWKAIENLKVRFTYQSDGEHFGHVYLDSAWLEVESIHQDAFKYIPPIDEVIDKEKYKIPSNINFRVKDAKKEFTSEEYPVFRFEAVHKKPEKLLQRIVEGVKDFFGQGPSEKKYVMRVVDDYFKDIAEVHQGDGDEYVVEIPKQRSFKPGTYTIQLEMSDGENTFYIDQNFSWGVLALNVNKSIYLPNEKAFLQMGVLDEIGHTLCDAKLDLTITNPKGEETRLSTNGGSIEFGEDCAGDTYIETSDYFAYFDRTGEWGEYTMRLTAETDNGTHTIVDSFEVRDTVAFDIERTGPTRIYPVEPYNVTLKVTAKEDYTGPIHEYVPAEFLVESTADGTYPFHTHETDEELRLTWDVTMLAGETIDLSYTFDAPNISPEFYLLGPLEVGNFKEIRQWQIASDAPVPVVQTWSQNGVAGDVGSIIVTAPSGIQNGDLLIGVMAHDSNAGTLGAPAGFTAAHAQLTSGSHTYRVWYKIAASESGNYTFTSTDTDELIAAVIRVSGVNQTTPINAVGTNSGTSANVSAPSVTTTVDNAKVIRLFGADDDDITVDGGYPSSHTGLFVRGSTATANSVSIGAAHATQTAQGATGAGVFTLTTTNEDWAATTLAIAPPQYLTVGATGNQVSPLILNTTNNYVGGAFTFSLNSGSSNVTSVTVNETGTIDAQNDLSNAKLFYELDTTAPYNCASVSYGGSESQFGSTGSFNGANGSVTFNGSSVGITATSTMCAYVVVDIDSSANDGDTIEVQISNPTTGVSASSGILDPSIAVAISGTTNVIIGYAPNAPLYDNTPMFESMKSTTTQPTFGGFAALDLDGDDVEYEFSIDDDYNFGSPATTTYSSNYPSDAGWTSDSFSSGATTTYRIQQALTPGTTYWWRVRAIDPSNKNEWGPYSEPKSVTISNAIAIPEWYQTTDEQFNQKNTRTNATSTGSDSIEIANLTATTSLLDAWSTGNSKTVSAGTDRILIVTVTSEEQTASVDVNTVTYGGQTLTEIYDNQIGSGIYTNGQWVGYLDDAGIEAATSNSIGVTWNGATPDNGLAYASAVFQNVDQSNPIRGYSPNALTSATDITPSASISVFEGDMAMYVTETAVGATQTHTPAAGYTEGTEQDLGNDWFVVATAYKAITADGSEFPTADWSVAGNRLLMTEVVLRPSPAEGTVLSEEIDFTTVDGQNDWGEITWDVTEPAGSETLLQVYYTNTTACDTLIPDGALSGNSTGFASSSSPIDITSLSTTTYDKICLKMTLSEGSAASSPALNNWSVSWERKPVLDQSAFRWYVNTNAITPTDPWPPGGTNLAENEVLGTSRPIEFGEVVQLRMGVSVSSVSATSNIFKLQYAAGDTCDESLTWTDVAPISSTTALWRGYNNTAASDGATLPSSVLSSTDELETYEEENNAAALPNAIAVGDQGEWGWVLEHRAAAGTNYCFRMVNSDNSTFSTYTNYAQLWTNEAPAIALIGAPFNNQKVNTTLPVFDFTGADPEGDDITYQIQIDDNADFSSTFINHNSETNFTLFENQVDISDKDPFNSEDEVRYSLASALTNGTTYWWRVRPVDPDASTEYGEWSTAYSFTVDTSVTISTWFQTTEEQFDTDTLVGTDATASDWVAFASGSTTGTTTGSAIDFDDGTTATTNAWGEFSFNETGAANNILYHVEYYNGSSWVLVPDSALSGNAAGYDTSPINLINLDTEIYNQIRPRANFASGSPTLLDWTITWGQRVSVPTHVALFDNEKVATTTPSFTFFTTDPQGDDLEYQFSYSTDNTFASGSTTVISGSNPGFTNLDNGLDTTPFDSGDSILYKIQSSLTNGTTYWWRVRARDPAGGNNFSFWSDPWSFTVDTTATTSTWFQTTEEQFDTDTLTSTDALVADTVSTLAGGVNTYTLGGLTNPSATHVARGFAVDVSDPTDPPDNNDVDSLTTSGLNNGIPNLRTGIAGYADDAEATTAQYTALGTSDNSRFQIPDPGPSDHAVFWASFEVTEDPNDINQIDLLLEGYQGGTPGADKAWFAVWRPGAATPYWEVLSYSTQTADTNFTGSLTTNIDEYFDGNNRIHVIFFNEDDSDSLFVDYVEVEVTSSAASAGTITSTPIDFNDGSGPAWGELSWNDSTPGFSNITYQVEYLNGVGSWVLIPDSALSGNSSGFSSSPVDLKLLNTTTYNEIRIVGNLTCNGVNCPTLNDWTVEWSRGFTIEGTAFEYNGTSSTTAGTVAVAVNGDLQVGKTGTISNGSWSIDNVTFFEDDVITVFVSGAADADEAVAVTIYDGVPDMSGLRLQKRHLTVGSDDLAAATSSTLGQYDYTDDEDLFYDVNLSNVLSICADAGCYDAGLVILPNNSFTANANVTTHDFDIDGTFVSGANTIRVNGSWDNTGTTTMTGSTVIFTATSTTETVDSTGAAVSSFNNVTFGETSGTATWNLSSTLDVNGNLLVTYGTLGRSTQPIFVAGTLTTAANGFWTGIGTTTIDGTNPTTWTDNNATDQNIGHVVVDGSSKLLSLGSTVVAQSMTIGSNDIFDSNFFNITIYESWNNLNTFIPRTGTVTFAANTLSRFITAGSDAFYNLTFNGIGGGWAFTEALLTVSNDFTVATGTVTMPTGTTTIAGSFNATGGTFGHNNGTMQFTSGAAETVTFAGGMFTNVANNLVFQGTGSWTITDTNATSTNDVRVVQGTINFPSGVMAIGGRLADTGGVFNGGTGTVLFYSSSAEVLTGGGSTFNNVEFDGAGSWSFSDANISIAGDLLVSQGTLTLPTGTLSLGGSYENNATVTAGTGTLTFNSTDSGETVDFGNSALYNVVFNGSAGGWTVNAPATTTNNFTLTSVNNWTLASGQVLSVGATFTNSVLNASTTWTGSTLSLESGDYSINTKTSLGDSYNVLRVAAAADVAMWNSVASTYVVNGSLYSQDHNSVNGDLYIFGNYENNNGNEYWSYATDFDGTALNATTSRQVDVRFASGATATFSSSTVAILGDDTASTTIANQGSGTYTVSVTGGSLNAQYYEFTNLGSTGLSLLGAASVPSLRDGSFTVGTAAGTAITLSSTTIDASPAKQIFNVTFATTTAIAATNVTQTDGTPSSFWWFRAGHGNLYGEAKDNDTGNPGSVRFDDSSLLITVSGTVFSDAGSTPITGGTCDSATPVVRVVVNGGTSYTGSCSNVDGSYSIPGVAIVGDPTLTIYLDNASGGQRGSIITRTPTADITDADIYANRVIVRNEDVDPLSIINLAVYDYDNDTDLRFTAATTSADTMTVMAGNELFVFATSTFTPGGVVTLAGNAAANSYDGTLYVNNGATFNAYATTTLTIGGRLVLATSATFNAASSTVLMNATTSGKSITAPSEITFNELIFNGAGGSWNMGADIEVLGDMTITAGTVTGTGDISLPDGSITGNGILSLGAGTTTIARTNTLGGTSAWTFYNLKLGSGLSVGTTTPVFTSTTTVAGRLTIAAAHFLDAGATTWDLSGTGTVFVETGTFLEDTSTIRYSGAGSNVLATTYYNLDLNSGAGSQTYTGTGVGILINNDLSIGGNATSIFDITTIDPTVEVNGDVTIRSNGSLLASDTDTLTIGGSYTNDGTFTGNSGTVVFDGTGTIAAGVSSFSNVTINTAGSITVSEHATATAAWRLLASSNFTLASGQSLAVGSTFFNAIGSATTWTGSTLRLYGNGNYSINAATTSDSYATLSVDGTTQIRMWNSDASTYDVDSTASLYSQDHANVAGDLYIYGAYRRTSGGDFWTYAYDFDGTALGGSARKVDVFMASGASVSVTGGSLFVQGATNASTTLQNQGSGTYGITVGGNASTSWRYYEVTDTNSSGLVFTGAPTIATLSNGSFEVSQNGGSGMTVGGTVINANPAKNFTANRFFLNGVGSGFNVTATGTSVSAWRFANHYGDIDGESFDVDPNGDPGYIAWDDSAALITVSGTVYSDEGSTVSGVCDGVTNNIVLRVAGITSYTTSCNATTGLYSVSNVAYGSTDSLVVYIDGEAQKGASVTQEPVSNINDLSIYESRVIVRHEGANPLSIDDMAVWDSSDDADIPFTAVSGSPDTLTLPANRKLIVWSAKNFAPGGNVTVSGGGAGAAYDGTLELYSNADWTGAGTESLSVGGSLILNANADFITSNGTTTFTTTGASRTIDLNQDALHHVAFTGSGSWNITDTTFTANGNVSMTAGTLDLPTGTSTFNGSFVNNGGTFDANGGIAYFNGGTTHTLRMGGSSLATTTFSGGTYTMTDTNATSTGSVTIESGTVSLPSGAYAVGGDFENLGGAITHNTSELVLMSTTGATLLASSSDLYAITFSGGGSYNMADDGITFLDDLRIINSSDVALASGTISVGGSFLASGGTFTNSTTTILFNSSDGGETINPGVSEFYAVQVSAPTGGYTLTGSATTTHNFTLSSANSFAVQSGVVLRVEGVFTNYVGGTNTNWNSSTLVLDGTNQYTINTKTSGADRYNTLILGANSDLRMWNSSATTTTVAASASLYSQDHNAANGILNIYGDFHIGTSTEYWNYARDFDGTTLTGTTSREVTVLIAQNATTTVDGGTLQIIGTSGNETTITNQGSGTYAFAVSDGTLNAQYYAFRNLNTDGLNLSGDSVITSLSYGDFELAVNGGTLITLASSTLNANASKVITGNRFATTTAITGNNVTLVGATSNAWTFTSHTGNLDGEAYDDDGVTDCGSIRWNDSACLITQQTDYRWRNDDGGVGVPNSEWYNSNWDSRQSVRINNADATGYTDAVVEILVTHDTDMQADFDDLRFTEDDGITLIPHWIGSSTDSDAAEVWVKVPSLAAEDTTTIFMYFNNPSATSSSSAEDTFIAADDFEDNDITEYSGQTTLFATNNVSYDGTYGLDSSNDNGRANLGGIYRLDQTVSQGETFRFLQYVDTAGTSDEVCTKFGVQSPGSANDNYAVCVELQGTDRIVLAEDVVENDSSGAVIVHDTANVSFATGWYEFEVEWAASSINVSMYNAAGTLVDTLSSTDNTYTSGGIGFTFWFNKGGWDAVSSRPTLTTEPSIVFGGKQGDGGASWQAAQNTAGSYDIGDIARLRLAIENSGTPITGQEFLLEYAALGAAPSCEAVAPASYVAVPVQSSCGTSPVCMQSSSLVTNGEATGDLLTGTEGAYVFGQLREDPSNITSAFDVDQDAFTELEYVVTPTVNTVDESLCFRVTDNGTDYDTYLQVARLDLSFDPDITNVTLNEGFDISLIPGTTTRVYATGTVTDLNGGGDLKQATSTFYRGGVGAACTPDNNNCYISQCSFTNCSGNSCTVSCYADMYFHTDATDVGSGYDGEEWFAFVEVIDYADGYDFETSIGRELNMLRAIDVNDAINYGSLAVGQDTGSSNASTTVDNHGNTEINLEIEGTDMTDGYSSVIPVNEQKFATSTFTYGSCLISVCNFLSSTPFEFDVELLKPTTHTPPTSEDIYWGIEVPPLTNSAPHSGINVFTPVSP